MFVAETFANHSNQLEAKLAKRTEKIEAHIEKMEKEINKLKKKF
jgi:predicted ribosome quality control (RQC) complex YloA/Tae2 family protein